MSLIRDVPAFLAPFADSMVSPTGAVIKAGERERGGALDTVAESVRFKVHTSRCSARLLVEYRTSRPCAPFPLKVHHNASRGN